MAMSADQIKTTILKTIPDAQIDLRDLAGDGDHYAACITSEAFRGLSRVRQHQLVYSAFGDDMGTVLHALAVKTLVPDA